jgi:NitT/TauT family transport system substrate-binding protein
MERMRGVRSRCAPVAMAAVLAATALAVSACGSSSSGGSTTAGGKTKITVAYLAVAPAAPLILAQKRGFFAKQNLQVKLRVVPGQSLLPATVSGQTQFSFTNAPGVLLAKSNKLPIKIVSQAAALSNSASTAYARTLVKKNGPIKTAADLNGKKIAVDALYQIPHVLMLRSAQVSGADPKSLKIQEIPFPAMSSALQSGKVDAISAVEPFVHQAIAAGARPLFSNNKGWPPNTVTSVYVTSDQYLAQHKDVVTRFQKAITAASAYAQSHPAAVRAVIPTFTKTPPQVAKIIWLPAFRTQISVPALEKVKKVMQQAGALKNDVDVNDLVIKNSG